MASPELQRPEDFILERVELTADRFPTGADLTNSVIEFNVFESIENIFLTGSLIFLDDNNLASAVNFTGTERITVDIRLPNSDAEVFTRTFIVSGVKDQVKANDSATVIQLPKCTAVFKSNSTLHDSRRIITMGVKQGYNCKWSSFLFIFYISNRQIVFGRLRNYIKRAEY